MDETVSEIEKAMVRIRRRQVRRALVPIDSGTDPSSIGVVDALDEGGEVTVGVVGQRLGVDPSRASRMVTQAVGAGLVTRVASQSDGRATLLQLTPAGRAVADHIHARRKHAFEVAMEGWSEAERRQFAQLLDRFVEGLSKAT